MNQSRSMGRTVSIPHSPGGELERIFPGNSEMARRMREFDWSQNPLGPPERWPQNLKTSVRITLTSRHPMFVWWSERLIHLHNDGYACLWPLDEVSRTHRACLVPSLTAVANELPVARGYRVTQALAMPITSAGDVGTSGVLVVGLNPLREFDDGYRRFLDLVAGGISAAIANAQAYEAERRRFEDTDGITSMRQPRSGGACEASGRPRPPCRSAGSHRWSWRGRREDPPTLCATT